jgi:hypothetical protein
MPLALRGVTDVWFWFRRAFCVCVLCRVFCVCAFCRVFCVCVFCVCVFCVCVFCVCVRVCVFCVCVCEFCAFSLYAFCVCVLCVSCVAPLLRQYRQVTTSNNTTATNAIPPTTISTVPLPTPITTYILLLLLLSGPVLGAVGAALGGADLSGGLIGSCKAYSIA